MSDRPGRREKQPSKPAIPAQGDLEAVKKDNTQGALAIPEQGNDEFENPENPGNGPGASDDQRQPQGESFIIHDSAYEPTIQGGAAFPTVQTRVLTAAEIRELQKQNRRLEEEVLRHAQHCCVCNMRFEFDSHEVGDFLLLQDRILTEQRSFSITSSTT